jgi:ubiquinone/menaquinone biosynthesis C-methylase UbiE
MTNRMSLYEKAHFGIIKLVHETLYSAAVDPYRWLKETGVTAGLSVLEVGCGPGFFTIPAAEMVGDGGHVLAIDNNAAAVDYVTRKVQRHGAKNIDVVLADAAHTGLPDGSQDLVFLYGVIHALWNSIDKVLAETHRVLKPGGTLSVSSSRLPKARIIGVVTATKLFHLAMETEHSVNFESLPEVDSARHPSFPAEAQ